MSVSRIITAAALGAALVMGSAITAPSADAASRIRALVNKVPITDNDVRRRAAFLKLRRQKGNLRKKALDELIDEQIKMQEARRVNAMPKQAEVDAAFLRFAKGNKMPPKILTKILSRSGVTPRGFKAYIRAQIAWQRAVAINYGTNARKKSRRKSFTESLRNKGDEKADQYALTQVVFVVPKGKRGALLKRRQKEARSFRTRFPGCGGAKAMAAKLRDVAVVDKGRLLAAQLPAKWRKDVISTSVGQLTAPKTTEKGVEMIAVCSKRGVAEKAFAGPSEDVFREQAPKLSKALFDKLRKKARVERR